MEASDIYAQIQDFVKKEATDIATSVYRDLGTEYGVAEVPFHTHNGVDSPTLPVTSILGYPVFATVPTKKGQNGQTILVGSGTSYNFYSFINGAWRSVGAGSAGGANTDIQFNDSGALGGQPTFTFDKATYIVTIGAENNTGTVAGANAVTANLGGGAIEIQGGVGNGNGEGGSALLLGGDGGTTGLGGSIAIVSGPGGATSGAGGAISILSGSGQTLGAGGIINIISGDGTGSAVDGGAINITAGNGTAGDSNGGTIDILAGNSKGLGNAGAVAIFGGGSDNNTGGIVLIQGGTPASGNNNGGSVSVQGGAPHGTGKKGDVFVGNGTLATSSNGGFVIIPTCAGTPTGTPGQAGAMVYDTSANKLWVWNGAAWKSVALT